MGEHGVTCQNCGAKVTNGLALCGACQQTLSVAIINVNAYYVDLDDIRPGSRVKVRSAYRSSPPPGTEPVTDRIAAALGAVDNAVSTWARRLIDDRSEVGPMPDTTTRALGWLESHIPSIVTLEWASEILRDMLASEKMLKRLLDKVDTGWYAGKCGAVLVPQRSHDGFTCDCACHLGVACDVPGGCGEDRIIDAVTCQRGLYGTKSSSWIRCPECGATHDAATQRESMMREARASLAPVSVVARAVVGLLDEETSVQRLANRIDQWVTRGKLHDLGVRVLEDGKPHRVYRIGDVFDLLGAPISPPTEAEAAQAC